MPLLPPSSNPGCNVRKRTPDRKCVVAPKAARKERIEDRVDYGHSINKTHDGGVIEFGSNVSIEPDAKLHDSRIQQTQRRVHVLIFTIVWPRPSPYLMAVTKRIYQRRITCAESSWRLARLPSRPPIALRLHHPPSDRIKHILTHTPAVFALDIWE